MSEHSEKPMQQNASHARLIAAAPEMYEALKEVERWVENRPEEHPYDTWKKIRAAIAKAEGGQ